MQKQSYLVRIPYFCLMKEISEKGYSRRLNKKYPLITKRWYIVKNFGNLFYSVVRGRCYSSVPHPFSPQDYDDVVTVYSPSLLDISFLCCHIPCRESCIC